MKINSRSQLVELMKHLGLPLVAVEVGVAEGNFSTELISMGIEKLYLVDIWETVPFIDGCASFEQEWHNENYKKVVELFGDNPKVEILKGFSHKMAANVKDGSLGLAYIDGDHTYQGAKADIKTWWPKLVLGGIMAFHDYSNPDYGVKRAVIEHMKNEAAVNIIVEDGDVANIGAWVQK